MELHALRIIREEAPGVEIKLSSQSSPELALALMRDKMDVAFLRRETQTVGLSFRFLKEPLRSKTKYPQVRRSSITPMVAFGSFSTVSAEFVGWLMSAFVQKRRT